MSERCQYPDWEEGITKEEHLFGKDGFCIYCGKEKETDEKKRTRIHYGEGGWDKEEGVEALKELRQKTYYVWKNNTELKSINGLALKQVGKMIEAALKRNYTYNPFCGKLVADINAGFISPHCEGCHFFEICYDGESLRAKMSEMTEPQTNEGG